MVVRLEQSLGEWPGKCFEQTLVAELKALAADGRLLQQGVVSGGYADGAGLAVSLLQQAETDAHLSLRVALFFHETLAGCSCGDDPVSEPVYRELGILIDRKTAEARLEWL